MPATVTHLPNSIYLYRHQVNQLTETLGQFYLSLDLITEVSLHHQENHYIITSSSKSLLHLHHTPSSYIFIVHLHHTPSSYTFIVHFHHTPSSYTFIMHLHRIIPKVSKNCKAFTETDVT